ncbi:MAG: hypothetical protein ACI9NC_005781 [Verrucomicrobiales bacterium]|jgi:hypothetical protein
MVPTDPSPNEDFTYLSVKNERSLYGNVFSLIANHVDAIKPKPKKKHHQP